MNKLKIKTHVNERIKILKYCDNSYFGEEELLQEKEIRH